MRIISSWILKLLIPRTVGSVLSLSFVVWVVQSVRLTDLLTLHHIGIKNFFLLNLHMFPAFLIIVLPISISVACGIAMILLKEGCVFTTVQSLAIHLRQITIPVLILSSFFCALSLFSNLYLIPVAYKKMYDFETKMFAQVETPQKNGCLFAFDSASIYAKKQVNANTYEDVYISYISDKEERILIHAKTTVLENNVFLLDDVLLTIHASDDDIQTLHLAQHQIDISQYMRVYHIPLRSYDKTAYELIFSKTTDPDKRREEIARLCYSLSSSLLVFIYPLINILTIMNTPYSRGGRGNELEKSLTIVLFIHAISLMLLNASFNNILFAYLHCVLLVIMLSLLIFLATKK